MSGQAQSWNFLGAAKDHTYFSRKRRMGCSARWRIEGLRTLSHPARGPLTAPATSWSTPGAASPLDEHDRSRGDPAGRLGGDPRTTLGQSDVFIDWRVYIRHSRQSSMTVPAATGLPRFSMPLELGLFPGRKRFGGKISSASRPATGCDRRTGLRVHRMSRFAGWGRAFREIRKI